MSYLITGAAGFIGFHISKVLLEKGETVIGVDNLNSYYDVRFKYLRLKELGIEGVAFKENETLQSLKYPNFCFCKMDIADKSALGELFEQNSFDIVCNLAAQAGIMYSAIDPDAFIHSNIAGFFNVLECAKKHNVKMIYASSSSVYGGSKELPFSENSSLYLPKNLYAKTKIANEYLAKIYSDYFGLQIIGLRFFSVYGTFGRPDMAYMLFAKSILNQIPINIYGDGTMKRDYTFVDDVITAMEKIIQYHVIHRANNEIYNIGSSNPIAIMDLITKLEAWLGIKAIKNFLPARSEEMDITFADTSKLENAIDYKPHTSLDYGLGEFIKWYKALVIFH